MEAEDPNGVLDLTPQSSVSPPPAQPVGIYGWRKRCIYAFLLILLVIIVMNVALTVWILRVFNFSIDGMETLRVTPKGLRVGGDAEFLKALYVDEIKSKKGQSLYMMSNKNVQLLATDTSKKINSKLVVGQDSIEATCESFRVQDSKGIVRMHLEGDKIYLGTKDASFPGSIEFEDSVSTPTLTSPLGEPLRVESKSSTVQVSGMAGVTLVSDAGSVTTQARDDLYLTSTQGAIHLQSSSIFIKDLPKTTKSSSSARSSTSSSSSPSSSSSSPSSSDIYQMCACPSGKLFLALAKTDCRKRSGDICGR